MTIRENFKKNYSSNIMKSYRFLIDNVGEMNLHVTPKGDLSINDYCPDNCFELINFKIHPSAESFLDQQLAWEQSSSTLKEIYDYFFEELGTKNKGYIYDEENDFIRDSEGYEVPFYTTVEVEDITDEGCEEILVNYLGAMFNIFDDEEYEDFRFFKGCQDVDKVLEKLPIGFFDDENED